MLLFMYNINQIELNFCGLYYTRVSIRVYYGFEYFFSVVIIAHFKIADAHLQMGIIALSGIAEFLIKRPVYIQGFYKIES